MGVRRELRNIHEYQADRSVIAHGQDIYEYQTTLLEEVMNHSSCLANGFNHSFIKPHNDMIVDSKTGDQYKLRGLKGGLPVDTCFYIRHQQGQVVEFTLIFPPLPRSVKMINYIQIPHETRINSGESTRLYHLNVKELLKKEKIYRPRPDGRIIK